VNFCVIAGVSLINPEAPAYLTSYLEIELIDTAVSCSIFSIPHLESTAEAEHPSVVFQVSRWEDEKFR
jgi:hypothetical protein